MAQNTIKNLVGNRDAIRRIMAMDANGTMDKIAENARKSGVLTYDDQGPSYNPTGKQKTDGQFVMNENVAKIHKNMPKAIIDSFMKNPGKEPSTSVLGGIDMDAINEGTQKRQIVESTPTVNMPLQATPVIDYSLLKTIINESVQENVRKYMSALAKKMISEGIGSGNEIQAIKIGKKISIISENGDIYASELRKVGNVNKKKLEG